MCDVLLGVPGCVTECDRVYGGSKLAKNSVTYFMDGPRDCTLTSSQAADNCV